MNTDKKIKVAIAVVSNRRIKAKTFESILKLIANTNVPVFPIVATEGYTIAENRNYCVCQAIKEGCTHVLFIDDDMVFPEDTLDRLLSHNKEIIGVNSHSRTLPLKSTVELFESVVDIPESLFMCKTIGFGVALIDLKVMEKIERPWFGFESNELGMTTRGEDAFFCYKALEKGIGVWCDPTLKVKHIGDYLY